MFVLLYSLFFQSTYSFILSKIVAEVFPDNEFLGWYSTGSAYTEHDTLLHKQLMRYNESPVYLLMDSVGISLSKELPVLIYESEVRVCLSACFYKDFIFILFIYRS